MLYSSLDTLLKVSKTTYPKKLFAYDCVTLYLGQGFRTKGILPWLRFFLKVGSGSGSGIFPTGSAQHCNYCRNLSKYRVTS